MSGPMHSSSARRPTRRQHKPPTATISSVSKDHVHSNQVINRKVRKKFFLLRRFHAARGWARFTELADRLVDQFKGARGARRRPRQQQRLTLENIASLGGLTLAQRAHARIAAGAPAVAGLTPAQRFFLANATLWRANISPALLQRTLAGIDPHSPRALRVLGPVSNLESFRVSISLPTGADHASASAEDRDLVSSAREAARA